MGATTKAPGQPKQPSRKGKKAWRKNVDIAVLEDGLETVRNELIQGGVVVEKHSDELFALDTVGDAAIKKAYNKIHKPLKADEILAQRSAVPAVDSRKRAASKVTDGVLEPTSKRRRGGGVSYKELERLKRLAYGGESVQKDVIQEPGLVGYDPWAEDAQSEPKQSDANFSFLQPPKPIKPPKTLKRAPISLAANGRDIPAVQKPKPEASYNPQSTDYLEAFIREAEKEAVAEQRRVDEAEAEKQQLAKAAAIAAEKSEDDDIGLGLGDEESAWEGIESEGEVNALLSQKRPQRKTKAQRNKIARRKEAERKAAMEAQVKAREQQAARARAIAKEIEARERAKTAALTTSDESNREPGDDAVLRRRQLGRAPIPDRPLELVLPSELQESLRLLKPEGNLLKDRFRSVLVRGKIETRQPIVQFKKARTTTTEKWSYKDWKIKV